MEPTVQEAMQDLLAPLIRSLGPTNAKLLTLIKSFEPGAESLILRIIKILTENGRPNANLVALVKELISDRDLDARFLMPIIAEMDKVRGFKCAQRLMLMALALARYCEEPAAHCIGAKRQTRAQGACQVGVPSDCRCAA